MGLERVQQMAFEVGQLGVQKDDVVADGLGHEDVIRAEFALQRGQQYLGLGMQVAGMGQGLFGRAAARRQSMMALAAAPNASETTAVMRMPASLRTLTRRFFSMDRMAVSFWWWRLTWRRVRSSSGGMKRVLSASLHELLVFVLISSSFWREGVGRTVDEKQQPIRNTHY